MLTIRMQRTGRSGHAQFRVIVQDSRFSPTRGRVVAYLGSYDPHTKTATLDSEKAAQYLGSGAQPSDRVAQLLKKEGLKLPDWVKVSSPQKRAIKNPEKLRRNRPAEEPKAETAEAPAEEEVPAEASPAEPAELVEEKTAEASAEDIPDEAASIEEPTEAPTESADPAAEPAPETPAEK